MNRLPVSILVVPALLAHASAQTYPPPVLAPASGSALADPCSAAVQGFAPTFQVVDALPHHDDFWSNMLTGDADHDGRQEIVLRFVPVTGSAARQILFYEDDGLGNFQRAWGFPLFDGGLLALGDVDGDGRSDLFFERALGPCNHEYVRMEASASNGFPDHEVWTATKQGNVVDFSGFLGDLDGDGLVEFVVSDADFTCVPSSLKVFESRPGDQMALTANLPVSPFPGNPVVADFDGDGLREVALADGIQGQISVFESLGNDALVFTHRVSHTLFNSYQLAVIEQYSPDGIPMLFLAGQQGSQDYRVHVYESPSANALQLVNDVQVPALCGASIPQLASADVLGNRTPELALDRLCDLVPVYTVGAGGALTLYEAPVIVESLEIIGTRKTLVHSGTFAIGTFPTASNPQGETQVLMLQ